MALVNVQRTWSGEESSSERGDGKNQKLKSKRSTYTVLFDSIATAEDAEGATGIPVLDEPHVDDAEVICFRRSATPRGPFLWDVRCEFAGEGSPLTQPYDRHWTDSSSVEEVDTDYQGYAVRNPVGDRYTGLTMDVGDPVYVVTRNEAVFPESKALEYRYAVNSQSWGGFDAYQWRMFPITGDRIVSGANYYWRVTYRIQLRGTWRRRVLVEGKRCFDAYGRAVVVRDADGLPRSEPARLDANGYLLSDAADDVWQYFDLYPPKNFGVLGLL